MNSTLTTPPMSGVTIPPMLIGNSITIALEHGRLIDLPEGLERFAVPTNCSNAMFQYLRRTGMTDGVNSLLDAFQQNIARMEARSIIFDVRNGFSVKAQRWWNDGVVTITFMLPNES